MFLGNHFVEAIPVESEWKLIALDIDGTTLAQGRTLSDENRKWITTAKELGVDVTFATGRHRRGLVSQYVEELGIQVPYVTLNGGEVWTPDGKLLARHVLNTRDVLYLYSLAQEYEIYFWGATVEQGYNSTDFPEAADIPTFKWIKFGYHSTDGQLLANLWSSLEKHGGFTLSNSDPFNVEVNALGVDKAAGLQAVTDFLNICPEQVVVMGDSLNDVPMFRWAGLAVAMGNAQAQVKREAHQLTATCEENGVAQAIRGILTGTCRNKS